MSEMMNYTQMDTEEITKKILELKLRAHIEDVKLKIQKLAQLADDKVEQLKNKDNVD